MDAFETWRCAALQRRNMRIKTASAFEHLYLSLGQRAIRAWQEGVSYQQKVCSFPLASPVSILSYLQCVPMCHVEPQDQIFVTCIQHLDSVGTWAALFGMYVLATQPYSCE